MAPEHLKIKQVAVNSKGGAGGYDKADRNRCDQYYKEFMMSELIILQLTYELD